MPQIDPILKKFSLLLLPVLLFNTRADAIVYAPISSLRLSSGILSPATSLGRPGVQFKTLVAGDRSGGAAGALTASIPFSRSEDPRNSGWAWGLTAGASETAHEGNLIYTPGHFLGEFMIGRGTTVPLLELGSGLRGFMEIAVRIERHLSTSQTRERLQEINRPYRAEHFSTAIRMGAASARGGKGLVEQAGSQIGYSFLSSLYFPHSRQSPYFSFQGQGLYRCGLDNLSCGLSGQLLYSWSDPFDDATKDLRYFMAVGPAFNAKFKKVFDLTIRLQWTYLQGFGVEINEIGERSKSQQTVVSPVPLIESTFTVAF